MLLTMSLSNDAQDYSYNVSIDCGILNRRNPLSIYNYTGAVAAPVYRYTKWFGLNYSIEGTSFSSGYLNKGDVVKLCWRAPRNVNESEDVKISIVPKVGSILVVETTTPDLMVERRISIFP
jgi:archaellin